ncbi:hypothetical protein G5B38_04175 [Pseudohalocynthiibacter aestuariivivens]|nr:hypothetical protein [Pseudohalocynthiibacter aestuariivivens]QIE44789.1 hypothetical protein G5B38_04175 [Pseudohalocynthiibacter aestuariivivens]
MANAPYPIIALWSHPRSMSTATERIMRERGDLDCAHEPFMYEYYVGRQAGQTPHFDVQPGHPTCYEDIRAMLLKRADAGPVFFKDMSYYVMPRLLEDTAFLERLTHAFLIRYPEAAIASYHKLDAQVSEEEIGIAAQWQHYQGLVARGLTPPVLRAEDIRNDPKGMMAAFWAAVDLPYTAQAFDWAGDVPEDWAQVEAWHGSVTDSRAIRPLPEDYHEAAQARFDAAAAKAPQLREYLATHRPAYEALSALALDPLKRPGGCLML